MFLHDNKEYFSFIVNSVADEFNVPPSFVEKDYYVSMILREMNKQAMETMPNITCVFKGGTSLSKAYHIIDRFSEDVDIAFAEKMSPSMRRKIRDELIPGVGRSLGLDIESNERTNRSKHNYSSYLFKYDAITGYPSSLSGVKLESTYMTRSFPTNNILVGSYLSESKFLSGIMDFKNYGLEPFQMSVQSLERTLIDKTFALCDYYIENKLERNSRHIYDLNVLVKHVDVQNDNFKKIVHDVRVERLRVKTAYSANSKYDLQKLLTEVKESGAFVHDYETVTKRLGANVPPYNTAITAVDKIIASKAFVEDLSALSEIENKMSGNESKHTVSLSPHKKSLWNRSGDNLIYESGNITGTISLIPKDETFLATLCDGKNKYTITSDNVRNLVSACNKQINSLTAGRK